MPYCLDLLNAESMKSMTIGPAKACTTDETISIHFLCFRSSFIRLSIDIPFLFCDSGEVISQHLRFTNKYLLESKRQNFIEHGNL